MFGEGSRFERAEPIPSMLRQSAWRRLAIAALAAAVLWAAVIWAVG